MTLPLEQTKLFKILSHPENLASAYITDIRLQKDIWNIEQELPILHEDAQISGKKTLNFKAISLLWLKDLTKLAVLIAVGNRRWGICRVVSVISATNQFNAWLVKQGYVTPSTLTSQIVQQWAQNQKIGRKEALRGLLYVLRQINCIQFKINFQNETKQKIPKIIFEEVKYKIDLALEQLDPPIYLLFKLHETLGTRSCEIAKLPLDCLRSREGVNRIRICTGKQNDAEQEQDIPEELVLLVQRQQSFVRKEFGDTFPWLFPNWITYRPGFSSKVWPPMFKYRQQQIQRISRKLNFLLKRLIEENDIRNNDGTLACVTTHMFRRTYATVADRMDKRPDLIQHGLRHTNPDMQNSYISVSPQQQEKRIEQFLVNKDGQRTTIYSTDQDSQFLSREWVARQVELGVCTRPLIMKDCEFEYVCLGCQHIRFAQEHLTKLHELEQVNQQLLERCLENGQSDSRRANSARQFISILNNIIASLQ